MYSVLGNGDEWDKKPRDMTVSSRSDNRWWCADIYSSFIDKRLMSTVCCFDTIVLHDLCTLHYLLYKQDTPDYSLGFISKCFLFTWHVVTTKKQTKIIHTIITSAKKCMYVKLVIAWKKSSSEFSFVPVCVCVWWEEGNLWSTHATQMWYCGCFMLLLFSEQP